MELKNNVTNISIWHWYTYTYRVDMSDVKIKSDSYWYAMHYKRCCFKNLDEKDEWEMMRCHCSLIIRVTYIRVKRLFSLLHNHVQQHILNTYSLLLMVDENINHKALLPNNGSISISIFHY